ncbi:hypothetical protein A11A3_17100, partial [Alcanivorax hongdengensis A-11-3]
MKDKKNNKKISDNPSSADIKALLPVLQTLGKGAGFLGKLGLKRENMLRFAGHVDGLVAQSRIIDLPDRFNEAFGPLGWIAVGSALSVDIINEALSLHAKGKIDEAENKLVEWFTAENIELFAISRADRFHQAGLRDNQLKEALQLYLEKRYMAAVPLILIACDGFASDIAPVSPFEKDADLSCFDSITGHSTALPELMKLITKGVRKSRDDELELPLRHGILHGRSLGYANKKVCAKAWLLMMALVDWAIDKSSEDERRAQYEKKQKETLSDVFEKRSHIQADRKAMDAFEPYHVDLPLTKPLDPDSPENALSEFLSGWKAKNFGKMALHAVNLTQKPVKKIAGEMRSTTDNIELINYEILSIHRINPVRCDVRILAKAKTLTKEVEGEFSLVIFRFAADGNIAMPSQNGRWSIQQNFMYNIMHEKFATTANNKDTQESLERRRPDRTYAETVRVFKTLCHSQ